MYSLILFPNLYIIKIIKLEIRPVHYISMLITVMDDTEKTIVTLKLLSDVVEKKT